MQAASRLPIVLAQIHVGWWSRHGALAQSMESLGAGPDERTKLLQRQTGILQANRIEGAD